MLKMGTLIPPGRKNAQDCRTGSSKCGEGPPPFARNLTMPLGSTNKILTPPQRRNMKTAGDDYFFGRKPQKMHHSETNHCQK